MRPNHTPPDKVGGFSRVLDHSAIFRVDRFRLRLGLPSVSLRLGSTPLVSPPSAATRVIKSETGRVPESFGRFALVALPLLSALIVLGFGMITYGGLRREAAATSLVTHTHAVIEENDRLIARLVDAESGERGFVITGDPVYLDSYHGASAEIDVRLRTLRDLAADNSRQNERLDTLERLVRSRLASLETRIATLRRAGLDSARAELLRLGGGKPIMDSVRQVVAAIDADEQQLLLARRATQRSHERTVVWIVGLGTVVAALLALAISLMLSRSAAVQARLAREVRARAEEAEAANRQLQEQGVELEMLNEELQTSNEQLEERTAEAESANRIKAEFLANMSHDLRTPLNAIIGYVDLLEAGVRGPLLPEQHADVSRIKRSGSHLLGLISQVLDFAKVEAGHVQLHLDDVPVEGVLAELRPLVEPQVQSKGLAFRSECDADLVVRADREKLDQILVNLVGNAIKFTDPGGRIDVVCRAEGSWVRTDVRDTGEGIPTDQLDAVFAPFVQVERGKRPRESQGVGLGLSISRQLARAMHGDLTVASAVGKGSTFTLRLPQSQGRRTMAIR